MAAPEMHYFTRVTEHGAGTSRTAPAQRNGVPVRITAADGTFLIQGLSDTEALRISARLVQGGTSYISKSAIVTPGATTWVLRLQTEDPRLPGRRKD